MPNERFIHLKDAFTAKEEIHIPNIPLLMQAVVEKGDKTDEGQIIRAVTLPWYDIIKLLEKNPRIAYQIKPRKWEEIIAGAYERDGFEVVILTPYSGDYGRDIIAVKRDIGLIRIIEEVKAYKPGHRVKAKEVRALMGAVYGDGASKGYLTTTSEFAPKITKDPLIAKYVPSRIELIDGEMLRQRLIDLSKKK